MISIPRILKVEASSNVVLSDAAKSELPNVSVPQNENESTSYCFYVWQLLEVLQAELYTISHLKYSYDQGIQIFDSIDNMVSAHKELCIIISSLENEIEALSEVLHRVSDNLDEVLMKYLLKCSCNIKEALEWGKRMDCQMDQLAIWNLETKTNIESYELEVQNFTSKPQDNEEAGLKEFSADDNVSNFLGSIENLKSNILSKELLKPNADYIKRLDDVKEFIDKIFGGSFIDGDS